MSLKKEDFGLLKEKNSLIFDEKIIKKDILLRCDSEWKKLYDKFKDNQDFFIEKVFRVIKGKEIKRKINLEEFQTIKNLVKFSNNPTFKNDNVLLLHHDKSKKMFIFSRKDDKQHLKKLQKEIEANVFMHFNGITGENEKFDNLYEQKKLEIFLDFFKQNCQKSKISIKHYDLQLISIVSEKNNRSAIENKMESCLNSFHQSIFFQILLDVKSDTANGWVEKIMRDENIYVSSKEKFLIPKFERPDCVPLSFYGALDELYNYFKTKPKHIFLTKSFYLFLESSESHIKIIKKLIFKKYLASEDIESQEGFYFIDLSNKRSDVRFPIVLTFLKPTNQKKESCVTTPTKKVISGDFGSSEKNYKEQSMKAYRGYESEKKENESCKKLFTTSSEEEKEKTSSFNKSQGNKKKY